MTSLRTEILRTVIGLSLFAFGGCQSPASTTRCVYESGAVSTGRCLTQCESQCALEAAAGCEPVKCVATCDEAALALSAPCADARYEYWRCLRLAQRPAVQCRSGVPAFTVDREVCAAPRAEQEAACPAFDAGP